VTITNMDVQHPATALRRSDGLTVIASLRHHWPEYLMEVGEVGLYLFVACVMTTLLDHPASIVRQSVSSGVARRALMGLVMGATAIAIVISRWEVISIRLSHSLSIAWERWNFGIHGST
jgi:hypothetical protein